MKVKNQRYFQQKIGYITSFNSIPDIPGREYSFGRPQPLSQKQVRSFVLRRYNATLSSQSFELYNKITNTNWTQSAISRHITALHAALCHGNILWTNSDFLHIHGSQRNITCINIRQFRPMKKYCNVNMQVFNCTSLKYVMIINRSYYVNLRNCRTSVSVNHNWHTVPTHSEQEFRSPWPSSTV